MSDQVLAVQRVQDYIEAHLYEEISMADLARVSCYSPWHIYRIFRKYTGLSPSEYIRRFRLSRSAMQLKNGNVKVINVALDQGFGSVDGYQRAFLREFGCNPGEYSREHFPIPLFIPYGVKFRELRRDVVEMKEIQSVFIQLVKKPARECVIKRGVKAEDYFSYCEEVGCDVWGVLSSMDSLCGEPVCLWLPDAYIKPGTSKYVQGIERGSNDCGIVPEDFDVITLPESEYLVFQGEPFQEEDYCEAIEAVQSAIEKYDPTVIGYQWDDSLPNVQLEPRGERGYIELRAVKKK